MVNYLPLDQVHYLDATAVATDDIQRGHQGEIPQVPWQTWRSLLRLLPSDLTISIGANDGMVLLLRAVIDTMRSSTTANPSNRAQKRRPREHGLGS